MKKLLHSLLRTRTGVMGLLFAMEGVGFLAIALCLLTIQFPVLGYGVIFCCLLFTTLTITVFGACSYQLKKGPPRE